MFLENLIKNIGATSVMNAGIGLVHGYFAKEINQGQYSEASKWIPVTTLTGTSLINYNSKGDYFNNRFADAISEGFAGHMGEDRGRGTGITPIFLANTAIYGSAFLTGNLLRELTSQ